MSYHNYLNPKTDIKVGEQYQYEDYFAGIVKVLDNLSDENDSDGSWIGFEVEVVDVIFGGGDIFKVGHVFSCGYREGYEHYAGWAMKPVGSHYRLCCEKGREVK